MRVMIVLTIHDCEKLGSQVYDEIHPVDNNDAQLKCGECGIGGMSRRNLVPQDVIGVRKMGPRNPSRTVRSR